MFARCRVPLLVALVVTPATILATRLNLWAQSAPPGLSLAPTVTTVLPQNTAGLFLIDTTEQAWSELNQFQLFRLISAYTQAPPSPGTLPFLPSQLSFEADVKPWIGSQAALALMPVTEANVETAVLDQNLLLVAPVEHADRFASFVDQVKAVRSGAPAEQTYQDVTLLTWAGSGGPGSAEPGLAIALLPDYLAMAGHPAPLQQFIDQQDKPQSLADHPDFQRTRQHPQFERSLLTLYGNLAEMGKFAELTQFPDAPSLSGEVPLPFPVSGAPSNAFSLLASVGTTIEVFSWVQPEGLQGQIRFYSTNPLSNFGSGLSTRANPILSYLPGSTYLLTASREFNQQWQYVATTLAATPLANVFLERFRSGFQATTGLDFDRDLVAWLDRDIAFFVYPSQQSFLNAFFPETNLGLGLILQTSDRPAAEVALQAIDRAAANAFGLSLVPRQVKNQPAMSWEIAFAPDQPPQSFLSHSWLSEDTLVITSGAGALETLIPKPIISLNQTHTFVTASRSLPRSRLSYSYANVGALLSYLHYRFLAESDLPELKAIEQGLGTVRSVSASSLQTDTYGQTDILLVLAPAN